MFSSIEKVQGSEALVIPCGRSPRSAPGIAQVCLASPLFLRNTRRPNHRYTMQTTSSNVATTPRRHRAHHSQVKVPRSQPYQGPWGHIQPNPNRSSATTVSMWVQCVCVCVEMGRVSLQDRRSRDVLRKLRLLSEQSS